MVKFEKKNIHTLPVIKYNNFLKGSQTTKVHWFNYFGYPNQRKVVHCTLHYTETQ